MNFVDTLRIFNTKDLLFKSLEQSFSERLARKNTSIENLKERCYTAVLKKRTFDQQKSSLSFQFFGILLN